MTQTVAVSHIFHPSRWRRWAGSVAAWAGRSQDPAAPSQLGGDARAALPARPSLQPRGAVTAGGGTGFILRLAPGWDATELVGRHLLSGRARSPGMASLPGCSRHREVSKAGRYGRLPGASRELAAAPRAILRWRTGELGLGLD